MRKNDLKSSLSRSKEKDKTIHIINNNIDNKINFLGNINTNRSYNKTKLIKKNKKVKFSIPINLKNTKINYISNTNKFSKNNNSLINTNNTNNTNNNNLVTNFKKNIIHRHTKSSFIQGSNLLLNKINKDMSMTNINNNIYNNLYNNELKENKISLNNFMNNNPRLSASNITNKKINNKSINKFDNINNSKSKIKKIKSIQIQTKEKKDIRNNLLNIYPLELNNTKNGLGQIIEELNSNKINRDNNGLTKKFIEAQNNWRKNYFAIVIQKIYRGYHFRKNYKIFFIDLDNSLHIKTSNLKKNNKNDNISAPVYIKKKIKYNHHSYNTSSHNKEYPTDVNNRFNRDNKVPHEIKEIVISMKSNKQRLNDNNLYLNNYMYFNMKNNMNYSFIKSAFDSWKEYADKISILKKLKIYKKYKKNNFRKSSYEKKRNNNRYKI